MFGDILVPLDGSAQAARALHIAVPLCRHLGSPLRVVSYANLGDLSQTNHDVVSAMERLAADDLDVDVTVEVPSKIVPEMLLGHLSERPGTLLCMSTHGRGRSALLTGSIANEVLRQTSSPVVLVGPACEIARFKVDGAVVVAADGSELSEAIIPAATAWAIVTDSPLKVVTVLAPAASKVASSSNSDLFETSYVHSLADKISLDLDRQVDFDALHGSNPAKSIIRYLRTPPSAQEESGTNEVSIIAMATHGASGMARVTAGSIMAEVLRSSPVPVLAVRPPDLAVH